jgi:hypothetical protein
MFFLIKNNYYHTFKFFMENGHTSFQVNTASQLIALFIGNESLSANP